MAAGPDVWPRWRPWLRRRRSSGRDDDSLDDLVGDRLPLGVPEREQVPDVADDAVDDVADVADERHQHADGLAGLLADQAQVQHLLAEGLPGGAGLVPAVIDGPPDAGNDDHDEDDGDPAEDDVQDDDGRDVDQVRANSLDPAGVSAGSRYSAARVRGGRIWIGLELISHG